jgi:hypothetical protein
MNFLNLKWLKIYIFENIIGGKSEDKNINKMKNIENNGKAKSMNSDLVYITKQLFRSLSPNVSSYSTGVRRVTAKY